MPFDPLDPRPTSQQVTNDQSASANPPATPASPSTAPVPAPGPSASETSAPGGDFRSPTFPQNAARSTRPAPGSEIVSNAPQPDENAGHPLVKHAGVLNSVARALAGNPTRTVIDPNTGETQHVPVPLTKKDIGFAIALEAISGSLTGLAAGRGRGPGAAGAAALQQSFQRRTQQQQQMDEQARTDADNRAKALAAKAAIAEVNSRTLLNTAEAEKYSAEGIDRLVEINRASGALDADPDSLDNGGEPVTQQELLDGMKSGKYNSTDHLGPVAGRVEVTDRDGTKRWEATHLVIRDPSTKVALTQDDWDRYAAAGVPGYKPGIKIGAGTEVSLSMKQRANEILAAHSLSDFRLKEMREILQGTQYADKVPTSIDFTKPGVQAAMQRFQKYISHSNQHGMDVYESLQAMGADRRDPKTGQMAPNPDAKYVDTIASAMGGWSVLHAVHDQLAANRKNAEQFSIIDSEAKANAVLASPTKFTKDQVSSAKNFLTLSQQQGAAKAAQEARQRAIAEGKDTEAMLKTGINPITGERLTLANAPDSMLVDSKGRPVPQNQQSLYKPSGPERQTADTARQALQISAGLRAAVQKNPNLVGPLLGNYKKGISHLGFGDAEAQKLLDDVNFLQSAATKVHTGRFSSEILKKMSGMIKPGMNLDQFIGGLNSIDEVMQRYAQEDKLVTVADLREMQQGAINTATTTTAPSKATAQPTLTNIQVNPQTGQHIGWDGKAWVDVKTRQPVK